MNLKPSERGPEVQRSRGPEVQRSCPEEWFTVRSCYNHLIIIILTLHIRPHYSLLISHKTLDTQGKNLFSDRSYTWSVGDTVSTGRQPFGDSVLKEGRLLSLLVP